MLQVCSDFSYTGLKIQHSFVTKRPKYADWAFSKAKWDPVLEIVLDNDSQHMALIM